MHSMAADPATRRRRPLAWGLAALAAIVATSGACSKAHPVCYDGEYLACTCDDGAGGFQACAAGRAGYGACVCDGRVPGLDASLPEAGEAGEAAAPPKVKFLEPCEKDEQCETGLCYTFNARGPRCTQRCTPGEACPAPSPGCSNNGVCKSG
jgi:hypothetical protein